MTSLKNSPVKRQNKSWTVNRMTEADLREFLELQFAGDDYEDIIKNDMEFATGKYYGFFNDIMHNETHYPTYKISCPNCNYAQPFVAIDAYFSYEIPSCVECDEDLENNEDYQETIKDIHEAEFGES